MTVHTRRRLFLGFGLCGLLTGLPFAAVTWGQFDRPAFLILLALAGLAQAGVHLYAFLDLGTGPGRGPRLLATAFTAFVLLTMMGGTVWIMADLEARMMPVASGGS